MFNCLANIASIITLILFVIYVIGRVAKIQNEKRIWKDKIIINSEGYSQYQDEIVDEVHIKDVDDPISGLLVSKQGIRDLKVYSVVFNENTMNTSKGELIYSRDFLNIDQAVAFCVQTGDLFPSLFLEYNTKDYMKIEIEWRDNLKSGVMSELIKPKHTFKSIVYYFFA